MKFEANWNVTLESVEHLGWDIKSKKRHQILDNRIMNRVRTLQDSLRHGSCVNFKPDSGQERMM